MHTTLTRLEPSISTCEACPRLARYCAGFRREGYWGRPVPGFGDPKARLVILGLAPGAHGANRTGRPFTGDAAGNLLYEALHACGLATLAKAHSRGDGLELDGVFITNAVKCAPPQNKPSGAEVKECAPHLLREYEALRSARVVLALGRVAHDAHLSALRARGVQARRADFPFAHGAVHPTGDRIQTLVDSFHPSRYNVNVGKLDLPRFLRVVQAAWRLASE